MARDFQIVVDCREPDRVAAFWEEALQYEREDPPDGHRDWWEFQVAKGFPAEERVTFAAIHEPGGGRRLCFMGVPEAKTTKNRLHLDIDAGSPGDPPEDRAVKVDELVTRLVSLGATVVRTARERGHDFVTLADVEGNELCVH